MNINAIRAEERHRKIVEILATIKKAFENGLELNFEALINQACFQQRIARRTAMEYINIALSQVEHKIEGKGKNKLIIKI